jgi:hypothetical protein
MQKRRLFASANLAAKFPELPSAPFTWTRAGFKREIGFSGFEHLAAPSSPSRQRRGLSGRSHLSTKQSQKVDESGFPDEEIGRSGKFFPSSESMKFPVFSLLSREFGLQRRVRSETASSRGESHQKCWTTSGGECDAADRDRAARGGAGASDRLSRHGPFKEYRAPTCRGNPFRDSLKPPCTKHLGSRISDLRADMPRQ